MSSDENDKLGSAATREVPAAQARKPRPMVWSGETGESLDTFATPSETTETRDPILDGPEPPVFGGLNPDQGAADDLNEPLGTPLEEAIRGDELIPDAPKIEWRRVIRSTWFLLTSMILLLASGSIGIWHWIETETYVQMTITFNQYQTLNEEDADKLRKDVKGHVFREDVLTRAKEILRYKSPDVQPGFLTHSYAARARLGRGDGVTWTPEGELRFRALESTEPADDRVRLAAFAEAFYEIGMKERTKQLGQLKQEFAEKQSTLLQQQQTSLTLKQQIDGLLAEAERYSDLKLALQGLERYIELADASNPLRLVALQNVGQLAQQVDAAREISVRRDALRDEDVILGESIKVTEQELARLGHEIEVFAFPSPPDPNALVVHDTRGFQQLIMRGWWILVIVAFAVLVVSLHIIDNREAERARRERRELLKRRPKLATNQ